MDAEESRSAVREGAELSSGRRRILGAVVSTLISLLVGVAAFAAAAWLLPGLSVGGFGDVVVAVLLMALVGAIIRPVLRRLALLLGWAGIFFIALFLEAVVVYVALDLSPGVEMQGFWTAFVTSWWMSFVLTVSHWAQGVNQDEEFVGRAVKFARRRHKNVTPTDQPGVVFVQLDGVSEPLMRWAVMSGNLPTICRWARDGSHALTGWRVRVPTTTPVSQAGILLGSNDGIPAFRWWEKDTGKLMVANHPPDAALIEDRLSTGQGLLADDGVSISNIFTGDAPLALLTMAGVGRHGMKGAGKASDFAAFFTTPYGFFRLFFLAIGEMFKERYQARREIKLDMRPRVPRPWSYVGLRAATNVLQRQLNTSLVVEQMMRGAKSIYVDYLDYDEVAHHAGVSRPESLATLAGLDRVVGQLEMAAKLAPRPYSIVLVSDHGQSQGEVFSQRFEPLEDLVRRLMRGDPTVRKVGDDESYGPLNTLLTSAARNKGVGSAITRTALGGKMRDGTVSLGPDAEQEDATADETPELVVVGSGNLGAVWFAQRPGRVTLEDLTNDHPDLIPGLVAHEGVSFLVVMSAARGVVAIGPSGVNYLDEGSVDGEDPLERFGPQAAIDFRRTAHFSNAPDLYLNSMWDEERSEVAAFEGLVGCHGGLGGWQDQGLLIYPADWTVDQPIVGADELHNQLVRWLERQGHRTNLPARTTRPSPDAYETPSSTVG
ncbi:MAG TPA: phage holin family protein [Actinomycetes bacterium]|nr:phage holin family protein [Actinomycetes bacterium]